MKFLIYLAGLIVVVNCLGGRNTSLKLAKFRQWLKYDTDCMYLREHDLQIRIANGKCPPDINEEKKKLDNELEKKKPKKSKLFKKRRRKQVEEKESGFFSHKNKETVLRTIVGDNKMIEIDVNPSIDDTFEIIQGSMVTLKCDDKTRKKQKYQGEVIEWYVNGRIIKSSWFDWRISLSEYGDFGLWPIDQDDSGHFECWIDGKLRASTSIKVVSMSLAILFGFLNYLYVSVVFGLATLIIGWYVKKNIKEEVVIEVDKMEEFLSEHVFKTDEMAKKHIADIIAKNGVLDERQIIENRGADNRTTIMMLLQNPKLITEGSKKSRGRGAKPDFGAKMSSTSSSNASNGRSSSSSGGGSTKPSENETDKEEDDDDDDEEEDEDDEEEKGKGLLSGLFRSSSSSSGGTSKNEKDGKKEKKKKGEKKKNTKKKKDGDKKKDKKKKKTAKKNKKGGNKKGSKNTKSKGTEKKEKGGGSGKKKKKKKKPNQ